MIPEEGMFADQPPMSGQEWLRGMVHHINNALFLAPSEEKCDWYWARNLVLCLKK